MNCRCCNTPLREDVYPEQRRTRKDGAVLVLPSRTIVTCDNVACAVYSVTLDKATYADTDLTPYYSVNKAVS